jgi:hypothetical protein
MQQASVRFDETAQWLIMSRGSVVMACNFADASYRIPCPGVGEKELVLSSEEGITAEDNEILMPGETVAILIGGKDDPLFEIEKTQ